VQFLAVFAPEVGFCRVNNEFHVFTVSFEDRMVRENTQLLGFLVIGFSKERGQGRQGYRMLNYFINLLLLLSLLEIYCGLRSKWLTEIDIVRIINFWRVILCEEGLMDRSCQWSQLFFILSCHWIGASFDINIQVFERGFFVRTNIGNFFKRLEQASVDSSLMHRKTRWLLEILFHHSPRSQMDGDGFITKTIWRCEDRLLEDIKFPSFIYYQIFTSLFRRYIPFHIRQALCDRGVSLLNFNGPRRQKLLTIGILHLFPLRCLLLFHTWIVFKAVPLPDGYQGAFIPYGRDSPVTWMFLLLILLHWLIIY
jgi:hypothetical protein